MSERNPDSTELRYRKLKGVIPPKRTDPDAVFEAINRLREFVKRFPGLGEEVMKEREQNRKESRSPSSN